MAVFRIAAVIKKPSGEDFLVVRQSPPPPQPEEEYQKFVDSDLWDLPSAPLNPLEGKFRTEPLIEGADALSDKLDLRRFDVYSALNQVIRFSSTGLWGLRFNLLSLLESPCRYDTKRWKIESSVASRFSKSNHGSWQLLNKPVIDYLSSLLPHPAALREEEIGWFSVPVKSKSDVLVWGPESCKWLSMESTLKLLLEVKASVDRVGPFVAIGLLPDSAETSRLRTTSTLHCQEYPPGIMLVPMKSRTREPFHTTNLVVMVPSNVTDKSEHSSFITYGDALLMDPGCCSQLHVRDEASNRGSSVSKTLAPFKASTSQSSQKKDKGVLSNPSCSNTIASNHR
ncbi:uncharacterized protein [Elaeis guineensis]|uniref:uncharacterized protein n=1 Tax=Elaeis guineensis var. tenera TaxID=51953 RepID=UPI003C6D2992